MTKIVRNTLIYTLGNILPQAVNFILLPLYTKYLVPSEYGVVNAMAVVQAFLAILFTLSLERSIIRMYFDYKEKEKEFLGTLSIAIGVLSIIVLMLAFLLKDVINIMFKDIPFYPFFFFTIITTFSITFSLVPKNFYRLKKKASKYFFISIIELILNTSLAIYFLVFLKRGAEGIIQAKMYASLIILPVFLTIIIKNISFTFDWNIFKNCISFSFPTIPTLFAAWILSQADRVFIAGYLNLHDLGIYSLSTRVASLVGVIALAFTMAYHPLFFEMAQSDEVNQKSKLEKMNNAFILILLFLSFILALFSKELIILFLDIKYRNAYIYIPAIISTYFVGSISSSILGAFFQQSKKMTADMFFGIFGAGITVLFNYLLIKEIGLWGSILGNFIATITIFLLLYNYAKRECFFIPIRWKIIISSYLILIFLIIFFNHILVIDLFLSLVLKSVILIVIIWWIITNYKLTIGHVIKNI